MFRRIGAVAIRTIKEVFDTSTEEGKIRFQTRVASIAANKLDVCEATKETEAAKYVISTKPGCTYIVTSGLHGDVANENGDFFPWTELLAKKEGSRHMYESWVGCPVLLNHDSSKRIGTIIDAIPIKEEKSIDFLLEIENQLAPMVVNAIKKGDVVGTSMGVLVGQSICNICENLAYEEADWCFVGDTEILLKNYTNKPIRDICVGDEVITHNGEVKKVTKLYKRNVDQEISILSITSEYRPLMVTKNHPMLAIKAEDIHCKRDSKQSVCSSGCFVRCGYGAQCKHEVSKKFAEKEFEYIPAGELKQGDWLLTPVITNNKISDELNNIDLLRLLGWYLAEGCIAAKQQDKHRVEFSINKNEEELTENIKEACRKVFNYYEPKVYDSGNSRSIRVCNDGKLADLCIKYCGEYAKEKTIHNDILNLPNELLKVFLMAYIDGDGYVKVNANNEVTKVSMETASKNLSDQLMYICDKLGLHAHINCLKNEPTKLVPAENLTIYRVTVNKTNAKKLYSGLEIKRNTREGRYLVYNNRLFRLRRIDSVMSEKFNGSVYNLEVEDNHTYVANNVAVHNCDHLSPKALNLKGRVYLGQDGGQFKEKVGQKVEEINMLLEGVEDSIITFGEPADPDALIKKVLAKKDGSDDNMPEKPVNPNRGSKGSVRSVDDRMVSAGVSGGAIGAPSEDAIAREFQRYKMEHGLIPGATPVVAKFDSPAAYCQAIKSGKLAKTAAIEALNTFRLASASQIENLTANQAYALLEQAVKDENEMLEVTGQAEAPVVVPSGAPKNPEENEHGTQSKETNKVKPEEPPKAEGKPINDGTPNGEQAKDTNKAKGEEQPTPEGKVKEDQFPSKDKGDQACDTNKSKTEASKQIEELEARIAKLKQIAVLEEQIAQLKNSDMPKTPNGTQNKEVNSTNPEDSKPAPKKVPLNSGTPNGSQAKETNGTNPEDSFPKAKTAGKAVTAEEEEKEDEKEEKSEPKSEEKKEDSKPPVADVARDEAALGGMEKAKELVEQLSALIDAEVVEEKEELGEGAPAGVASVTEISAVPAPVDAAPVAPPTPMDMMYSAKLVKDTKNPQDSYYVVKHKGTPIFSVSAKQAYGSQVAKFVDVFHTEEYKNQLENVLKVKGARKAYKEDLNSKGVILAQMGGAPVGNPTEDALPDVAEPQAPAALVEDKPLEDMSKDDPKKSDLEDAALDFLKVYVSNDEAANARQVAEDLVKIVAGEGATVNENFAGKLEKMIEDKKKEDVISDTPDTYKDEALDKGKDNVPPVGGGEAPTAEKVGPMGNMAKKKFSEVIAELKQKEDIIKQFTDTLPMVTAKIESLKKENEQLKDSVKHYEYDNYVKARVTVTAKLAEKMATVGLIEQEQVKDEALRLAKLEDAELAKEAENLEKSIKMAKKLQEKQDYKKVEGERVVSAGKMISMIPSQMNDEVSAEDDGFEFSKAKQQ